MSAAQVLIDGVEYRPFFADLDVIGHKFCDLMRAHRNGRDWTLDQAAKLIGCSKSYLHGMESGAHEPSLRMAFAIQSAYGFSMKRMALALPKEDA